MSARKVRQEEQRRLWRAEIRKLRVAVEDPAVQAVIDAIYDAFEGVHRMDGVSWNQANVADDYGTDSQKFPDTDRTWEELVTAEWWYGEWCYVYLDPVGFRYYIPAGMIRALCGDFRPDPTEALREKNYGGWNDRSELWPILSLPQVEAICSFFELLSLRDSSCSAEYLELWTTWTDYLAERLAQSS